MGCSALQMAVTTRPATPRDNQSDLNFQERSGLAKNFCLQFDSVQGKLTDDDYAWSKDVKVLLKRKIVLFLDCYYYYY
jgi:hypothetical protein